MQFKFAIPALFIGLSCRSDECSCKFAGSVDGVLDNSNIDNYFNGHAVVLNSITECAGVGAAFRNYSSLRNFLETINYSSFDDCVAKFPLFISFHDNLLSLVFAENHSNESIGQIIAANNNFALSNLVQSSIVDRRNVGISQIDTLKRIGSSEISLAAYSEIKKIIDAVYFKTGKTIICLPGFAKDIVTSQLSTGFFDKSDALRATDLSEVRNSVRSMLYHSAQLGSFGIPAGQSDASSVVMNVNSSRMAAARRLSFCIPCGYPVGLKNLVNFSCLPNGQTYRARGSSVVTGSFVHDNLKDSTINIFMDIGKTLASFAKASCNNSPVTLGISCIESNSVKSDSWLGLLPDPRQFCEFYISPLVKGVLASRGSIDIIYLAQNLEKLISIATSKSDIRRFGVRRSLEHQFLGRPLLITDDNLLRNDGAYKTVKRSCWDAKPASIEDGTCLPDEFWAEDSEEIFDWKSCINLFASSDSNWKTFIFSQPSLPSKNPFKKFKFINGSFNSKEASSIWNSSVLRKSDIIAIIRWEMLEWTRMLSLQISEIIKNNGSFVENKNIPSWKFDTYGNIENQS